MHIYRRVEDIQKEISRLKQLGKTVGFVPTMGALHQGHLSLIKQCRAESDLTVASVFVNPTQFNDPNDFEKYPRTNEADIALLESSACDILFLPAVEEMYQNSNLDVAPLDIGYLDSILEGAQRPGHYQGVSTIVEKLFKAVLPDMVFLGLKDFQQVKVIEKLIRDRILPIKVVGCPTIREPNGLAMSSRNIRLTDGGRARAGEIYQALQFIEKNKGKKTPQSLISDALHTYFSPDYWQVEYLELRNSFDLSEVDRNQWERNLNYVILFAGWLEGVRLIDNISFDLHS